MTRIRSIIGTAIAFLVLAGFTALIILAEYSLDVTKAHKAGG
jgi:hypothetical protein